MITVHFEKKRLRLPESFKELTAKQFIEIAAIIYQGGEALNCDVLALRTLAGLSRFSFRVMNTEFVDRCLPYIKWIYEEEKRTTDQLIPKYKGYYGPSGGFDNLKMKEFHFSEMYYRQLVQEKDELALDLLVATLYREPKVNYDLVKNPDGDQRRPFNDNELEYQAALISAWPQPAKQAIFIWYDTCRNDLIKNNKLAFENEGGDFESQFDTGIYGMIRSLAGDKLGTVQLVEEMYVHTAMLEIGLMKEQEKHIEEKTKQAQQ